MEQLFSAFGIDWRLLLAQAVNFAIVLLALRYFLYKPVMKTLEKRQTLVAQSVKDAESVSEKLAGADDEVAKRVAEADTQADEIVTQARDMAGKEKQRLLKEAEARAASVTKDAEARAKDIGMRAERESEKEIARVALLAAEKILKERHD